MPELALPPEAPAMVGLRQTTAAGMCSGPRSVRQSARQNRGMPQPHGAHCFISLQMHARVTCKSWSRLVELFHASLEGTGL